MTIVLKLSAKVLWSDLLFVILYSETEQSWHYWIAMPLDLGFRINPKNWLILKES